MRFVPTFCLREGMILGDNLYNNNGVLMLSTGVVLTREYIRSIERFNFNGVYVDDEISRGIQVVNIIDERARAQAIRSIKEIFKHIEDGDSKFKIDLEAAKHQIESIVDEIMGNKHVMVNMIDMKVFDDYTYYHSVNVSVLSIAIGVARGLTRKTLCNLGFAAMLHDIGKVFIKKEILNKPGKLSDEEFDVIKTHSRLGYEYIQSGFMLPTASCRGILDHHEKFNGTGYPDMTKGEEISLFGRIISLADVYDALTSDRPYRKALLPSEAMEFIMGSSTTLFDPKLVEIFVKKVAPYPIGTIVRLSNELIGIVIENNEHFCMRPKLRIFKDKDQEIEHYNLDLAEKSAYNITITEVMH